MIFKLFIILLFPHKIITVDYCSNDFKCGATVHTACGCLFDSNCKEHRLILPTDRIRLSIVETHNRYRERVASGKESRGGVQGTSVEMYALKWDRELEYIAMCWNKHCKFAHDECRKSSKFDTVGQNIYWATGMACDWARDGRQAIDGWYEEIKEMTPSCVQQYGQGCDTTKVGHFSQVIWSKTTHVGCSLVEYEGQCQITCNYGPSGNFMGEPLFHKGSPRCTFNSEKYDGLCLLKAGDDDREVPPDSAPRVLLDKMYLFGIAIALVFILL